MPLPTGASPVQFPEYAQTLAAAPAPPPPQFNLGSPVSVFANSPPQEQFLGLEQQALPPAFVGMPPQEPFFGLDPAGLGGLPLQGDENGAFWSMLPPAGNGGGAFASSPPAGNGGGAFAPSAQYHTSSPLQGNEGGAFAQSLQYHTSSPLQGNEGGAFASSPQYIGLPVRRYNSSPPAANAVPKYTQSSPPAAPGGGAFAQVPQYTPSSPPPPPPEPQYTALSPPGSAFGMPWSPSEENPSNTRPGYALPPPEETRANMWQLPPSQPGPPYAQTPWVEQTPDRNKLRAKMDERLKKAKSPQPELRSKFEVDDIVRKKDKYKESERYIVEGVNPAMNLIQIRSLAPIPAERKRTPYPRWRQEHQFRHATPPDEGRAAGGSRHAQPAAYGYRMVIPAHAYAGWQGVVPVW